MTAPFAPTFVWGAPNVDKKKRKKKSELLRVVAAADDAGCLPDPVLRECALGAAC